MAALIQYLFTSLMLASILMLPVCGVRRILCYQLTILSLSHIYVSGLALLATMCWALVIDKRVISCRQWPLGLLWTWAIWGLSAAISMSANGFTVRTLFQTAEFAFCGCVALFIFRMLCTDRSLFDHLTKHLMWGALLLAGFVSGLYATQGAGTEDDFIGPNEAAFVLILTGIVMSIYQQMLNPRWYHWVIIASSMVAIVLSESRGGVIIAAAILAAFLIARLVGQSPVRVSLVLTAAALMALQSVEVQAQLAELFDLDRNYSNQERLALVETCIQLFLDQPYYGWGWGTNEVMLNHLTYAKGDYPHPHNVFAHLASELGIGGLATIVVLFSALSWVCFLHLRARRKPQAWLLTFVILTLFLGGMLDDYFYGGARSTVVAISLGIAFASRTQSQIPNRPANKARFAPVPRRSHFPPALSPIG